MGSEDMEKVPGSGQRQGRLTLVLGLATLIATFGSSFQYGYNVASVNSPAPFMKEFYNQTFSSRTGQYISDSILLMLWSFTVSLFPLGGFVGSLLVAPLVNKFGRKGTLLLNNILSIIPALMMGISEVGHSFEIIIVARFLIGICAGLSSSVVPMYLGEMSPRNLRGAIGVAPQLLITIGILMAQIFGIRSILGNHKGWPVLLAVTGIPAVLQLVFLPFFPESPRYCLIQKGDEEKAREGLKRLRGCEEVEEEIEEMRLEDQSEKAEGQLAVLNLCSFRPLRWQLISVIAMNMGQQLSGINAVYYYADSMYSSAGVEETFVQYVTVGTGAVNVAMTFLAALIVDALGRRILLLTGFGICCLSCAVLTVALKFQTTISWMPYLSIVCVIIFVIGHAIGPSPIPYVVTTEMFRQSSRPAAFMVAGSVHWLSNFTVGLIFPYLEKGLGPFSFVIFGAICLVTLLYIYFIVPETKNKTFLEVSEMMAKKNRQEVPSDSKEIHNLNPALHILAEKEAMAITKL